MDFVYGKHLTVARSVRMGYDVLSLDADFVVLDDLFYHTQQQPLSQYQLFVQPEWFPRFPNVNIGIMYTRGAAKDGPVAWALFENVFRRVSESSAACTHGRRLSERTVHHITVVPWAWHLLLHEWHSGDLSGYATVVAYGSRAIA
jgi:hypothetical protein